MLAVERMTKDYEVSGGLARRRTFRAVDAVSFAVRLGQTLALVGESGSGKSTIGRCLLNLTRTSDGSIRYQGVEIQNLGERDFRPFRSSLQMVFQNPYTSFNPRMKIGEALKEPMHLAGDLDPAAYDAEAIRLLEQVGLGRRFVDRYPAQMSGGQLQRIGVARAMAPRPELIFLDEPTSALDMSIRGQIVNLLLDQQAERNLAYILVTHDLRVVRFMADQVAVMYLGHFVEVASKREIFQQPLHPYTRGLFAAIMLGGEERHRQRQLFQLRGEVTPLDPQFAGCRLLSRCPFAVPERCRQPQELREIRPGHLVRCIRAEEIQQEVSALHLSAGLDPQDAELA